MEQVEESTGTLPEKMSADNGYMSGENLVSMAANLRTLLVNSAGNRQRVW